MMPGWCSGSRLSRENYMHTYRRRIGRPRILYSMMVD